MPAVPIQRGGARGSRTRSAPSSLLACFESMTRIDVISPIKGHATVRPAASCVYFFWFALPLLAALVLGLAGCTRDTSQREGIGTSVALAPVKPLDGEKTASNPVNNAAWARSKPDAGTLLQLMLDDQNLERVEVTA